VRNYENGLNFKKVPGTNTIRKLHLNQAPQITMNESNSPVERRVKEIEEYFDAPFKNDFALTSGTVNRDYFNRDFYS